MTKTDSEMVEDPPPELGSIGKRMKIGVPVNLQSVVQAEGQIARSLDIMRGDLYNDNGKDMKTMETSGGPLDRQTGGIPPRKDDSEEDTKKPSAGKVESCAEERQPNLDLGEAFQVNPSTTSILLKTPINGKINWKSRKRKLRLDEAEPATDEGARPEAGYYRSSLDSSHQKISTPRREPPELEMKRERRRG
ncbi:unnamed protein product [Linum trigynum]|uniref:Uncharacterized protein n=1 Tax=Linum trigynum TaxID=586398 RepID=A0AAV2CBB7_9ROSI